jgi:hypothetical protein
LEYLFGCTIKWCGFAFDLLKSERNARETGLPFHLAADFTWTTGVILRSDRRGEERYRATRFLGDKLHSQVFTKGGSSAWVIRLRHANAKEVKRYEKENRR